MSVPHQDEGLTGAVLLPEDGIEGESDTMTSFVFLHEHADISKSAASSSIKIFLERLFFKARTLSNQRVMNAHCVPRIPFVYLCDQYLS